MQPRKVNIFFAFSFILTHKIGKRRWIFTVEWSPPGRHTPPCAQAFRTNWPLIVPSSPGRKYNNNNNNIVNYFCHYRESERGRESRKTMVFFWWDNIWDCMLWIRLYSILEILSWDCLYQDCNKDFGFIFLLVSILIILKYKKKNESLSLFSKTIIY